VKLKDLLSEVPGLNKRLVYYLESQGYIHPIQVHKLRISRRDYGTDDLRRVKQFWTYYQRGLSVRSAVESAARAEQSVIVALLPVPYRSRRRALAMLREFERVQEAAVVYGETGDLIVWMKAADEHDIYSVLDRVFETASVTGVPRIWRIADERERTRPSGQSGGMPPEKEAAVLAYVLIKAPPKQVGDVVEKLRNFPGIVEACALYGESDVIAKIIVPRQDELDDLVMNQIQSLPAVESTRTFIAVGGMHWERAVAEMGGERCILPSGHHLPS
jgi:DNA-binding Lrp family transcriptional regulator